MSTIVFEISAIFLLLTANGIFAIAMFMAPIMRLLLIVCAPLVHLFTFSTDLVFRLVGKRFDERTLVTEEEITTLLRQGTQAGVFHETEKEMVEAVFQLDDMRAHGLMTPRTQIIWLDVNDTVEQIRVNAFKVSSVRGQFG